MASSIGINPLDPTRVGRTLINTNPINGDESNNVDGVSFADYLNEAINNVSNLQQEAETATEKLATGEIQDVHSVMIAAEKSDLALQYTLAIRNKILDAYSEIMRMQI